MAELAQEMLETDQRVEQDREDPVLSLNNLKDMPFSDFLVLHKIFPKIFMLEMDTKMMQKQQPPSRSKLIDKDVTSTIERQATIQKKMSNQESVKL